MNATLPSVEDGVNALVKKFPVEDIWLLEAEKVPDAGLEKPLNLIVVLREGAEAHHVEREAGELFEKKFPDIGVHAFPLKAMFQTPRPLLVKMAFTKGRSVYRG